MKKIFNIIIISLLTTILSGCLKSVSFTSYWFPDSIAIDYKNEQFEITTLITNPLANVNFETSSTLFPNLLLIKTNGKTINEAIQKLRIGEQQSLSPVHLKSLVLSQNIFKETDVSYQQIVKMLIQNPNHNLKIWVYLTDKEIEDIYSVKTFMNASPYFSSLNFPSSEEMNSLCEPINLITSANNLFEGRTTYLPMLSVQSESVKQESIDEDKLEEKKIYEVKDLCFISLDSNFKCFQKEKIEGFKWLQNINDIDDSVDNLSYGVKKVSSTSKYQKEKMLYKLKLSVLIYDNIDQLNQEQIKEKIKIKVTNQLQTLSDISYENNLDIFNIKDHFQRYYKKNITIKEDTINFEVDINILTQSIFD